MTTLTAQLAEGTRLSAADADAGPNGETLLLDNPVVRLEVEGGIDTATIVGSYVVFGTPLNDNYAVTFRGNTDHGEGFSNAGVYTVDAATFGEEDVYNQHDAEGFINLFGLPVKVKALLDEKKLK